MSRVGITFVPRAAPRASAASRLHHDCRWLAGRVGGISGQYRMACWFSPQCAYVPAPHAPPCVRGNRGLSRMVPAYKRFGSFPVVHAARLAGCVRCGGIGRPEGRRNYSSKAAPTRGCAGDRFLTFSRHLRELNGTGHLALALVETFETILFSWLLIELLQNGKGAVSSAFSMRPLVSIERISYGVYHWHMRVLHALGPQLQAVGLGQNVLIRCAVLTLASLGNFVS